jgi:hypothetical protein
MEVDFSAVRSCGIRWVERVRIKSSHAARGAQTPITLALLLRWSRHRPADCIGKAHADLRFDLSANGAQAFCLELGKLVADSADLLDLSFVEETQAYIGHQWSSSEGVAERSADGNGRTA